MTYPEIVRQLHDMKRLALPPRKGEKSGCFSSTDRSSQYDEKTGIYVNWHANRDGDGIMDDDGTMLELKGPGVIWRIWSAAPGDGGIEFYVDGDESPTFATPMKDLFANKEPFNYPALAHVVARGNNFFIPIPFQESLRIRGAGDWGKFYQITYTQLPEGTVVPSFTGEFSDEDQTALREANAIWSRRGPQLFVSDKAEAKSCQAILGAGEETVLAEYGTPAAITSIVMNRLEMDREASVAILRQLSIGITWDDDDQPAVWSPLGDFFGAGAGENLYRSLATGMTETRYYTNWYMPFAKARITVRNDGKAKQSLAFTIHTEQVDDVAKLLRYHYKWHRDDFSGFDRQRLETDRWPDWPVLKVDGAAGRFCGFQAHMWNPNSLWHEGDKGKFTKPFPPGEAFKAGGRLHDFYAAQVAKNYWWGEGDEKFFVDGEKMPSTFGTGSEDYFGYAWGTAEAFDSALQAQPRNGAADEIGKLADSHIDGNIGHISALRWQIPDNVPFFESFEATIEKYHPNEWPLLNAYAASWYQTPGISDYYGEVPPSERSDYFIPATPEPAG